MSAADAGGGGRENREDDVDPRPGPFKKKRFVSYNKRWELYIYKKSITKFFTALHYYFCYYIVIFF